MLPEPITRTPLRAQAAQRRTQVVHLARARTGGQRDLHHRQIGIWKEVHQRHPGAMVEGPLRVTLGVEAGGLQ